jgi:MiaB-like tRNA modifying enzyme
MVKKVSFKTFGCRTNIYDTQIMVQNLKDFELVSSDDDADIVVVNSCTVTNSADGSARSYINSLNKKGKKVILAGCVAFSKGDELFNDKKFHGVFGHSENANINSLLKEKTPFFELGDLSSVDETIVEDFSAKTKAFIKIQEGCDFNCSYCIIPSVRGNARSQDEEKILYQIEKLADNGFGEFVLTGTNIGSYGKDKKSSIATLLKRISRINGVKRVRLGSLEPVQIDEAFMELLKEPWLEKHLHIALQHTNEEMLRIMRRRNALDRDLKLFEDIASKGFALGTDFIVGHPGESEEFWQDALANFKRFPITHLHGFSYSDRSGTYASTLKDRVAGDVAKKRLKELEEIVFENNYTFRNSHNGEHLVLVEESKGSVQAGYDQYFNKILIKSDKNLQKECVMLTQIDVQKEASYATFV